MHVTLPVAQWMPDAALRAAVREALTLPEDVPLTKERMQELQHLKASGKGITNIRGSGICRKFSRALHLGDEGNYVTDLTSSRHAHLLGFISM